MINESCFSSSSLLFSPFVILRSNLSFSAFAHCVAHELIKCHFSSFSSASICQPWNEQQAVIEKFALCEENLSQLLRWITEVEYKISSVGGPKERIDELRNQINLLKVSRGDLSAYASHKR